MTEAISSRKHPFHLLTLAYVGDQVEACTIVLRGVKERSITFHTNVHSKKVKSFHIEPNVTLLGYDLDHKWQVRLKGKAICHHQNDESLQAWNNMKDFSKLCYSLPPPGCEIKHLDNDKRAQADQLEKIQTHPLTGYDNFVVVEVQVSHIESLHLHHLGHKRILTTYQNNVWKSQFISP